MVATQYNTITKGKNVASTSSFSPDIVYTVPFNHDAEITFLHISNGGSSNANVTIEFDHDDSSTDFFLLDAYQIGGHGSYDVISGGSVFYMHQRDSIKVFKSAGADIHIILSGREVYNPNRPQT